MKRLTTLTEEDALQEGRPFSELLLEKYEQGYIEFYSYKHPAVGWVRVMCTVDYAVDNLAKSIESRDRYLEFKEKNQRDQPDDVDGHDYAMAP
jgi:hypothetical protein